ncbi:cupin domain-containing protein [Streptomyces sp. NPDC059398]|uniref:cupin domain-containing protein n=1 Tax=Streptomyces sp. NPDC059398 TaxID=3346820 RepID=UPI0036B7F167
MSLTPAPGVVTDTARLLRDAGDGDRGALWRLAEPGRQLDSNVIRLAPEAQVAGHVEPDLDVLVCVVGGSGRLETADGPQELTPGAVLWLPHGVRRSLAAGADGLCYLTVHRRRPGLTIAPAAAEPAGGEAACLLQLVCPGCGRLAQESGARFCSRCGEELPTG